jgi:hypothetical protein
VAQLSTTDSSSRLLTVFHQRNFLSALAHFQIRTEEMQFFFSYRTAVTGIVFLVGAHNRINNEAWSVRVSPDRVIRHPNYNSFNFRNDIALYRLATRLTLSDYIVPICIPNGNDDFTNEIS